METTTTWWGNGTRFFFKRQIWYRRCRTECEQCAILLGGYSIDAITMHLIRSVKLNDSVKVWFLVIWVCCWKMSLLIVLVRLLMFLLTTGESPGSSFRLKWTCACKLLTWHDITRVQETIMDCKNYNKQIYIKYVHYEMFQQIETRMVLFFCRWHHFGYTFFIHQWNLRFSNCCLSPPFWKHVDHVFQGVRLKAHFRWPPRSRVISHWRHPNRTQHWWPIRCNSGWRRSSFLAVDSIQWFWCPLKHNCSQEFLVLCVFLLISFVSVFFSLRGVGGMENMETCCFLKTLVAMSSQVKPAAHLRVYK